MPVWMPIVVVAVPFGSLLLIGWVIYRFFVKPKKKDNDEQQ